MNRKHTALCLFLLLSVATIASAQSATKADLQALELKITKQITDTEKRIDQRFDEVEKRLSGQIHNLETRTSNLEIIIGEMDKRITARIDVLYWAITSLIGVVLAVIAVPQLLGYLQARRERADMQKQIDEQRANTQKMMDDQRTELGREIENLKTRITDQNEKIEQQEQEIEELKSRRILPPS